MNYNPYTKYTEPVHSKNISIAAPFKNETNTFLQNMTNVYNLFIDSRFASESVSNVDFIVNFLNTNTNKVPKHGPYKNVSSIEFTSITIQGQCLTDINEQYIVLSIEELDDRLHSNTPSADHAFCTILFDNIQNNTIRAVKGSDFDNKIKYFNPPLSSLNRLTIKLINGNTGESIPDHGYITLGFTIKTL